MVRKTTLTLLMMLTLLSGILILPHSAAAISLRQNSVVTGDTITVGDVFEGTNENSDKVLGLAPQPGKNMVLNARTLLRIAMALDLPWRPADSGDQVVLTRAASIVSRNMIEEELRTKFSEDGIKGKYKILISDADAQIVLSSDIPPGLEITDLDLKPETGWFEAAIAAPSAANPIKRLKINGTIEKLIDIPVLRTAMKAGEIIGRHDLDYIEISENDLRPGMVLEAENLIGMTPRRLTGPGKPLKTIDMESPRIITRGDMVTMLFQQGGLTLTASGKAMEHGAKGDVIRVVNSTSNKTIEGLVTGDKEVTITSF